MAKPQVLTEGEKIDILLNLRFFSPPSVSHSADSSPDGGRHVGMLLSSHASPIGGSGERSEPIGELPSPSRGRWHDEVVTNEVAVFTPHQSAPQTASPKGEAFFYSLRPAGGSLPQGEAFFTLSVPP